MAVFEEIVDENGVYKFFYDGAWRKSSSGKSVTIVNPTTRKPHFRVQGNLSFYRLFFFSNILVGNPVFFSLWLS